MKVWILKVLNDIHNNYQGIDDIEVYTFDTYSKAASAIVNRGVEAIKDLKKFAHCDYEDLEIEERKDFFHANNGNDYITCQIEEQEVL